jgi:hypothetical protein
MPILRLALHVWASEPTINTTITSQKPGGAEPRLIINDSTTPLPPLSTLANGYKAHYAQIRSLVPADRLLEWTPADGWEPLCRHLGVDVPEDVKGRPFIRTNPAQDTNALLGDVLAFRWIVCAVKVGRGVGRVVLGSVVVGVAWWLVRG